MLLEKDIRKPTKEEQTTSMASYDALKETLKHLKDKMPEIEIEETQQKIRIPLRALQLLAKILKVTGQGKPISIVPVATEVTTQVAADMLGCSRPHLIKLLENGKMDFVKVGRHRRIKIEDVISYKKEMKKIQKENIIKLMEADQESGLYDS
jgi:excisionase family DNA binding protein